MLEKRARELALLAERTAHSKWKYNISTLIRELSHEYKRFVKYLRGLSSTKTDMLFAEVFVNEFYRIEKQLRLLAAENAQGGTAGLWRLPGSNIPRILMLCREYIKLCDGAVDINSLTCFFDQYQRIKPLDGRETELINSMLAIALLERIEALTHSSEADSDRAAKLQTALNSISRLGDADIEAGIAALSRVNALLCGDAYYRRMDIAGKHLYTQAAAKLAVRCGTDETSVVRTALKMASNAAQAETADKKVNAESAKTWEAANKEMDAENVKTHVGYYLMDEGRHELIFALCGKKKRSLKNNSKLGLLIAFELLIVIPLLVIAGMESIISALLLIVPLSLLVHTVAVNLLTRFIKPKPLPSIIPDYEQLRANRTLVCVPVLITDEKSLRDAVKTIELHYLASRRDCPYGVEFCILGDFPDSKEEVCEGEAEKLALAASLINELNQKYSLDSVFHYLHRKRIYAQADDMFMGHERKRGAVNALMRLIKQGDKEEFNCIIPKIEGDFKFLTVLDADTVMPAGALKKLIGTMLHPLNRPMYRDGERRPYRGYSVVAPRMASTARSAAASRFASLISGEAGMSQYDNAVSDFYQDVFSEGCFGGKGIINIDAFMLASEGCIPDNTVLSHDMLEGCITRAAFAESILLYDGEPSNFFAWWKRRHRWLRGDFQLLPYLVSGLSEKLDVLSKYKVFMNALSGLGNIAYLTAIVVGCILDLPVLVGFTAAAFFIDPIIGIIAAFISSFTVHPAWRPLILLIRRRLLELITLPYAFLRDADAVARSIYRMAFSHEKMLEWQTAASSAGKCSKRSDYYRNLLSCLIVGIFLISAAVFGFAGMRVLSGLFGVSMLFAPAVVQILDGKNKEYEFSKPEEALLRETAKRTWRYFEESCTEETHFLPPDNFQEKPYRGYAALTSPTNIGMSMLAAIAAFDLKLIDKNRLAEFIENMTSTIERMDKWRGHLFNWYDIRTLAVPKPRFISSVDSGNLFVSLITAAEGLREEGFSALAGRLDNLAEAMDFSPLYDENRKLFHIGLEFDEGRLTPAHYDLLASEARLMSFALIAEGRIDPEHWFRLSRLMCEPSGGRTLKSWSGTMFEYLMPLILMETVPHSLQFETCRNAVLTEFLSMRSARPWGATESGFYAFDKQLNYQYKAFGNPSLSLEFRRSKQKIAAPYASLLALQVEPSLAAANLMKLDDMGGLGKYGFYEAVDFDKSRIGEAEFRFVQSYMAHHQGMGLCALDNVLCKNALVMRFMRLAPVRANEQLLFENMPVNPIRLLTYKSCIEKHDKASVNKDYSFIGSGGLISNGSYSVFMDENGRGFSKQGSFMLTRYDESLRAENGIEFYVRQGESVYSCAGDLRTDAGVLKLISRHSALKLELTCMVSAEQDCEIRTLKLINCGSRDLQTEVGIFAELAMAERREYNAHPAFTRICIDSRYEQGTMLFRSAEKPERKTRFGYFNVISAADASLCCDALVSPGRLVSRAKSMLNPLAAGPHSQPVEPFYTARVNVELAPGESSVVTLIAGIAQSADDALRSVKQQRLHMSGAVELAALQAKARLRMFNMDERLFIASQYLAHSILTGEEYGERGAYGKYGEYDECGANGKSAVHGTTNLWRFGISGDSRIILLRIKDTAEIPLLRKVSAMIAYLRETGLEFDFVMIGEYPCEYANRLKLAIESCTSSIDSCTLLNGYELNQEDRIFLSDTAALRFENCEELISFHGGFSRRETLGNELGIEGMEYAESRIPPCEELKEFNGYGGFNEHGEYLIFASDERRTPLPWSNIMVGESLGSLVTESGGGYTFKGNSRLMRITPWSNDVASDASGERITILIGDKKLALKRHGERLIRHGYGFTSYSAEAMGMRFELIETVDGELPVKYYALSVTSINASPVSCKKLKVLLSFDFQVGDEWHFDGKYVSRLPWGISIRNLYANTDEEAFLAAKDGEILDSGEGELLVSIDCSDDGKKNVFLLGMAKPGNTERLIKAADFEAALNYHKAFCREKLDKIRVNTPDEGFNLIVNRRLLYQVYASRLMGRTGFYQSGGAFGFRDQLQDVLALLMTDPMRTREQILRCAGVQFEKGDVLHWWHELSNENGETVISGVRTTITDDRLFLAYAVAEYLDCTEDYEVLDEQIPYLEDVQIPEGKRDVYCIMRPSGQMGSLYEHCIRAIMCSLAFGMHGLPLMGGGDWNDGMDRVGDKGGESVLLGFLLVICLKAFVPICKQKGDDELSDRFANEMKKLCINLENHAWNGEFYSRAFFADGSILGGREFIDCASECFAVFADAEHSEEAFDAVMKKLVDSDNKLIKLLSPPFDGGASDNEVGYIRGYLPGIRENGGQYTHAAAWCVIAACMLERAETADSLFKLINPIVHGSMKTAAMYKGEPYAVAGDVYSVGRLSGRVGWSWYTGAAAWLYRAAVENILGMVKRGDRLYVKPCTAMKKFSIDYVYGNTVYHINAEMGKACSLKENGVEMEFIKLNDDGEAHEIAVVYR